MTTLTNKTALSKSLGIARSSLYYHPRKPLEDETIKQAILAVQSDHAAYGHKRIARDLGLNKKRILRVMKKFHLHPKVRRGVPFKPGDQGNPPTPVRNIAATICPIRPNVLWVGDFTYLPWEGSFLYLATVLDVYSREIVGWHIGTRHTTDLVMAAFADAVMRQDCRPAIFHSDQGSEYVSGAYTAMLEQLGVAPSHSPKASPWRNGYQESFYSNFKLELGNPKYYVDMGRLIEAIHRQITYYNERRIHTSLNMSPLKFRTRYENKTTALSAVLFTNSSVIPSPMSV